MTIHRITERIMTATSAEAQRGTALRLAARCSGRSMAAIIASGNIIRRAAALALTLHVARGGNRLSGSYGRRVQVDAISRLMRGW